MTIPLPSERLVLIDLDGTILDEKYHITGDAIDFESTVDEAQRVGWAVGLSSDSAYSTMRGWREKFKMNGPIVAERGAVVETPQDVLHFDEDQAYKCAAALNIFRDYFEQQGLVTWEGDPVSSLLNGESIGSPNDSIVLINNKRTNSVSVFLRKVDPSGQLVIDRVLTEKHSEELLSLYPDLEDQFVDLNNQYGLLIIADSKVNKRTGTMKLQKIQGLGDIAMIGNSMSDYLGSDIALHYAVKNADANFHEVSNYSASKPLTEGVTEILRQLIS